MTDALRRRRGRAPVVEVVGTGTATATPDIVRVRLGIRCEADGVGPALARAADAVRGVSAAARDQGLADSDIASTGASVQPRWDRDGTRVTGYTAYHQLNLRVRQLDRLNDLVEAVAAVAGNALAIDSIALDLAEREPLLQAARAAAFADARTKAQQYAELSGASLGRVLHVAEPPAALARPGPAPMAMARVAADTAGMPVEAGEHTVTLSLHVTWAMSDT